MSNIKSKQLTKKEWLRKIRKIALDRGGKCLSRVYVDAHGKLSFTCLRNHLWDAMPHEILKGKWCAKCTSIEQHALQRTPFEKIYEIVFSKKGQLLTDKKDYLENGDLLIKCQSGHIFKSKAPRLKKGIFCSKCSYIDRGKQSRLDISEVEAIANLRGGKLISQDYQGNSKKLEWECRAGHRFKSSYGNVKLGTWCPICSRVISISERIVRAYFEAISGIKFEKIKPKWLVSSEDTIIELDGYNHEFKLAFEHHGTQHYVESKFYKGREFLKRKNDDEMKEISCEKNGVKLLVVNQLFIETSVDDLKIQIINFLRKNNAPIIEGAEHVNLRIDKFYDVNPLDVFSDLCEKKGGLLLTKSYKGFREKIEIKCRVGHRWKMSPAKLKQGQWCPECRWDTISKKNRKYDIKDMRKFAITKGGICLSSEYVANWKKLLWECARGHRWEANYANLSSGKWCPRCAIIEQANRQRDSIEIYKNIAKKRGGELLSTFYSTAREKLKFKCKRGHVFERVAYDVKKKEKWCHVCRRNNKN